MANVTSEADLQACYLTDQNYTVTTNITITADFSGFCIGTYTKIFDGGGYTIDAMAWTATAADWGTFKVNNGTIQNLTLSNVVCDAGTQRRVGVLVGNQNGTITNCHITSGTKTNGYWEQGGICGAGAGTITNCSNGATISDTSATYYSVGGIVGLCDGSLTMTGCSNSGTVNGPGSKCGGIVGRNTGALTISNCSNSGTISNAAGEVGGMIGEAAGDVTMSGCSNTGTLQFDAAGKWSAGGMIGNSNDAQVALSNCWNTGQIGVTGTIPNYYVGGIIGRITLLNTMDNCWSNANVNSANGVGGIIGAGVDGAMTNCYSSGTVTVTTSGAGGFIGHGTAGTMTFENCWSDATVNAYGSSGGFIGYTGNSNAFDKCYFKGVLDVKDTAWNKGGFVGVSNSTATFDNCYADGTTTFTANPANYCGGFIGRLQGNGTIKRCYTTHDAYTSSGRCGGFVGQQDTGAIADCFSTGEATGNAAYRGLFCGYQVGGTITNCGCYENSSGDRAIDTTAADISYMETDPVAAWQKNRTHNLFDTGANLWFFAPAVKTVTLGSGGSGYTVNDVLTITQTGSLIGATVTATTVVGGVVTAISLTTVGQEYAVENGLATTGGTGSGCTINITAVNSEVWYVSHRNYPQLEQKGRLI